MKKVLLTVLSVFLFLSGISYADAKTVFTPVKESEKASLKLNFETGYVGGIELKAKVSGNVTVTGVDFNSAFKSYTTRYNYDEKSKVLTIYITTGSNTKNLLDNNRNLNIGTLNVTSTEEKAEYSLELQSLVYVDANYASKTETDFSTSENSFVIEKQEPSEDNKPSDDNNNNKPSDNTNNNNNQNSNTNNNANSSNKGENNSDADNEVNDNESNSSDPSDNEDDNSNTNNNPSVDNSNKEEEVKKEKSKFPYLYVIAGVVVLVVVGVIVVVVKKED